jgi:hypothetical protein
MLEHSLMQSSGQCSYVRSPRSSPNGIVYFCCLAGARLSPEPRSLLNLLAFEVVRPLISITAHDSATVLLQSTKLL